MPCTYTETRVNMAGTRTELKTNMTDLETARIAIELCDLKGDVEVIQNEDGTISIVTRKDAQSRKDAVCKKYAEVKAEREARRRGFVIQKTTKGNQTVIRVYASK